MAKGGTTIGYHYLLTLVMNLCRGPVDAIVEIEVGGETAWRGSVGDATPTAINKPDLFGGEKREGGIQGGFRLLQGASDQVLPGDAALTVGNSGPVQSTVIKGLKALIGVPMGEMRGYAALVYDGLVSSMSPYPKEWKMRLRRHSAGWYGGTPWYAAKARILLEGDGNYSAGGESALQGTSSSDPVTVFSGAGVGGISSPLTTVAQTISAIQSNIQIADRAIHAMNPAHIIYQCMTDPLWGAGKPPGEIDANSFIRAANQMCSEMFGLCFFWSRQEDVDTFIQTVCDHVGGVIYNDRETGKYVLRLIRGDYASNDVPVYTFASGLLRIEEEDNASDEEGINEVIVKGRDPVSNEPFEVRAQNIASLQANGGQVISQSTDYPGIPTRALGLRVAQRDLKAFSTGLKRYRVVLDRRGWKVVPGGVIRIQAPERGIADMILRVGEVDYGDFTKREISCRGIEDVFAMPTTAFAEAVPGNFSGTVVHPLLAPKRDLVEANYRDVYRKIGETEANNLADTSAVILQLALAPTGASIAYDLASKVTGEATWRTTNAQDFTAFAMLAADLAATGGTATVTNNFGIDSNWIGKALLIGGAGGEIVRLDGLAGNVLTLARGCVDTVPRGHGVGAHVWALDDTPGSDGREYLISDVVRSQVLTRTSSAVLAAANAPTDEITLSGRQAMPYPPRSVKVGGIAAPVSENTVFNEPLLTWNPSDRIAQGDTLVGFDDAGVGPEPGVTWRVRVYNPGNLSTPIRTAGGLSAATWTYTSAMIAADALPLVVMRLDGERGGLSSWQAHQFTVRVDGGYGLNYGLDYGGA